MNLFTTEWLRAADDEASRLTHDYGPRYGREGRARLDRETIGGHRDAMRTLPLGEACCAA
jgi:hypothetical protein